MSVNTTIARPTLAVWKFASCDGCQLSLLDLEPELLAITRAVQIAHFTEMTRAHVEGPYDVSLVEGSITTDDDVARIVEVREQSHYLVTIGACAATGGVQALRNFVEPGVFPAMIYAHPEYLHALDTSTPVSSHVAVDYELRGCPIDRFQLLEVILALLAHRRPIVATHSVCQECKARGTVCLAVSAESACLGPVTRAGCNAICPSVGRGCFGCFGPSEGANVDSLMRWLLSHGHTDVTLARLLQTFNAAASDFREGATNLVATQVSLGPTVPTRKERS